MTTEGFIYSVRMLKQGKRALTMIEGIAKDIEPGQVYRKSYETSFGAFVNFCPERGLVHKTSFRPKRVSRLRMSLMWVIKYWSRYGG